MLFKNADQLVANGQTAELRKKRQDVLDILESAVHAVDPYHAVERVFQKGSMVFEGETVDTKSFDHIYVVGFGKASVGMARAVCDAVRVTKGVMLTNDASATLEYDTVEVIVGGHPLPNEGSVQGAQRILEIVKQCSEDDLLLVLISGGGSALFCHPRVILKDLQVTTDLLLKSGATIQELNTIRKHLSLVKGGQLVKQTKATVFSLIISDIVGDPLEFVASGPTYPDSTTFVDAQQVLQKYDLLDTVPKQVQRVLREGVYGEISETPKHDDPVFQRVFHHLVANNTLACEAAEKKAISMGYNSLIVTTSLTGEAWETGRYLAEKAKNFDKHDGSYVFISGGETTVTVTGMGKGGRNLEVVVGCIETLADSNLVLASFATDGIDGKCDAAGAIADGMSKQRAAILDMNPQSFLKENNSYEFFSKLKDFFLTGPTGTNVMDLQIILI